jgi:arylsulfatase A-like enzyme
MDVPSQPYSLLDWIDHVKPQDNAPSRREFLKNVALASATAAAVPLAAQAVPAAKASRRPNVLMICADQFRADFIGAARKNPDTRTKNLDAMARRGVMCTETVCNQPLCSPSRASFLTSRHATEVGVWKLDLELDHSVPTIADVFNESGYSTHFVGKWHVSVGHGEEGGQTGTLGWIAPGPSRGGFQTWEGANVTEVVSHPYHGSYWDNEGNDLKFHDQYRVDFVADRAIRLIEQPHDKPWFMFLSQLEPHQQNDVDQFVAPNGYAEKYLNAYVPPDLLNLSGNWQDHLPGYYGCVQAIDESIGRIVAALEKQGELDNTVIAFFSDHGNHFRTRIGEYKRSPHDASLRVPFILQGPGLDHAAEISQQVTLLDLAPTLLDAAGIKPPSEMRGRSILPLLHEPEARVSWDQPAYIQISASMCARAIRTQEWCYCVYDPSIGGNAKSHSTEYTEWALYSLTGDPSELRNLIGRAEYKDITAKLRDLLAKQIVAAGEPEATIKPVHIFNS